jgi:hypothetical protein
VTTEISFLDQLTAERKAKPVDPRAMQRAERFRDLVLAKQARTAGDAGAEIKQFEVEAAEDGGCFVLVETGRVGDEGTLAAIFCREYRHAHIGKRGGFHLLNAKQKSKAWGHFNAVHALTR